MALRLAALALACLALFTVGSARVSVIDRDEARFALAVREMDQRNDWVVPTNWGELRFQKPILCYWMAGASWRVLGRSELGLRLPSALSATLAVLLTAAAVARRFGARVGWRAGVMLATTLLVVLEAHVFTADAALLLGCSSSFWAWEALHPGTQRPIRMRFGLWLGVAFGALAKLVNVGFLLATAAALPALTRPLAPRSRRVLLAVLAAGAVAVAIPGLGASGPLALGVAAGLSAVHALRTPRAAETQDLGALWGVPLAVALFATWAVPALLRTSGAFFTLGVERDLAARTTRAFEGHYGFPGYYLATTLVVAFPWIALVPRALLRAWHERARDPRVAFLLGWLIGPWVLLELVSTKLPHYVLVLCPALAAFAAIELERRETEPVPVGRRARLCEAVVATLPAAALGAIGGVVALAFPRPALRATALGFSLIAFVVAALIGRAVFSAAPGALFRTLAGGAAALYLTAFGALLPALEQVRITRPLAAAVARHLRPSERLLVHHFTPASVGYSLPIGAESVSKPSEVAAALRSGPALVVVAAGGRERKLERILSESSLTLEHVDTVRGVLLPDLRMREVWLMRGGASSSSTRD